MDYKLKYLKYKEKYLSLKGGAIQYNGIMLNQNLPTILSFEPGTNKLVTKIDPNVVDPTIINLTKSNPRYVNNGYTYELIPLANSNFNLIDFGTSFMQRFDLASLGSDNVLKITEKDTRNYIEIYKNMKIFSISFQRTNCDYTLTIRSLIDNLDQNNFYIHNSRYYSDFNLNINLNLATNPINFKITGKLKIIQEGKPSINTIYFNPKSINGIKCDINEFKGISYFFIQPFDFQKAYDDLKASNNYCPQSTILFKQIYNSF